MPNESLVRPGVRRIPLGDLPPIMQGVIDAVGTVPGVNSQEAQESVTTRQAKANGTDPADTQSASNGIVDKAIAFVKDNPVTVGVAGVAVAGLAFLGLRK